MKISKYVYLERKAPQFVIYKTALAATPELFKYLKKLGISNWKNELEDVVKNKRGALKPVFISGIGYIGGGWYDWVYAFMFGNSVCFWGHDLGVGKNFIEINGTCQGYRDTHAPEIGLEDPTYEEDNPIFKLDSENLKRITALKNEMDQEFLLQFTDDDEEFIEIKVELSKHLKSFKKHKGGIYTRNWDNLEDLAGLSTAWRFTLLFSSIDSGA